ncbi:4Fe-4S dicluster domain-containing protein [Actinoplanes awajinensis]|uniref:4Fe-4S ferredoxin n=1 Tax=Actinoplanes awajinensis subsp. mycoplanecinus TaxID=135947 RepID=A0A101JB31_9ACTN|nr:4Fe-4S dicluster domain-containing protein [Actinoplanes awajinensis]KUL23520.1 4Fe-4S ferredoxin [Actinoplanes awajinensis subsp. mycoplanecinus]
MRSGDTAVLIDVADLSALFGALHRRGYTIVGPMVRDGAVVVAELGGAHELPYGWGVDTEAGHYRLWRRADDAAFAHCAGPQSFKDVLHPPRARLWSADRAPDGTPEVVPEPPSEKRYALFGARPCDLAALGVLDRVLTGGDHPEPVYTGRRDGTFVVVVECTEPGATCFCASMGTGPHARDGFDLALTELVDPDHRFLVRTGSPAGAEILAEVPTRPAPGETVTAAAGLVDRAAATMTRHMPDEPLPPLIAASRESPHWDDVASRCLTCGNCTMVCPTCFCTTTEEVTDLTGDHVERWRHWDSCFSVDFSYLHGGAVRTSGQSRYRQWISHKLGTWPEQFGMSGCVGCGRCIAWCPAGIDITAEAAALAASRTGQEQS